MEKQIAGLFPGQGSQTISMGKDLYDKFDIAKDVFNIANKVLGFSLSSLCHNGPIEELTLTKFSQPAILTVSYICWTVYAKTIAAATGHSLGEYSALVAAKSISFEEAVLLVHKRGCYMQEAVAVEVGEMLAVMGADEEQINKAILELDIKEGTVEIANLNSPGQIVVAGTKNATSALSENLVKSGAKIIPLKVSAPFHCSLMKPAADRLAVDLDAMTFSIPSFPVYCNATGKKLISGEDVKEKLKQQVCSSVRWIDCIKNMIEENTITTAIEFGPGGVLSKLLKRINPKIERLEVYDKVSLEKIKS